MRRDNANPDPLKPAEQRFLQNEIECTSCGKLIPLRSFRPPPVRCPQCGELRDKYSYGCFVTLLFAMPVAVAVGFLVDWLVSWTIGLPLMAFELGVLAFADVMLAFSFVHAVRFRDFERLHVVAVVGAHFLVAIRIVHGFGLPILVGAGIGNALLGFIVSKLFRSKLIDEPISRRRS